MTLPTLFLWFNRPILGGHFKVPPVGVGKYPSPTAPHGEFSVA